MDQFIGEIRIFTCDFAPRDWAACDGQLLPVSQNTALYSILGVMYGGDGRTNFALPNLSDRIPIGAGAGPGLTSRQTGEMGGDPRVTLTEAQIPTHGQHTPRASTGRPGSDVPGDDLALSPTRQDSPSYHAGPATVKLSDHTLQTVYGGGGAHNNQMPTQSVNFCIALQGIFPPRP